MNVKILTLSVLVATVFLSTVFLTPPVQTIPMNRTQCNLCHASGGAGTLTVTYPDGSRPENNIFEIAPGETIGLTIYGIGAQDQNEPGVALIFEPQIYHHVTVEGASSGGEGSYAYYVRDGEENDQDPKVSNIKAFLQLTVDESAHTGQFSMIASYQQAGPTGVNVELILKIAGPERKSSAISLLVSPLEIYANKGVVFFSGAIRPANVDHIDIEIRSEDEWQSIALVQPGPDGDFFYEWRPTQITEYSVRAIFEGDQETEPAESEIFNVSVTKSPETFMNQIMTAMGLGLLMILIGIGLFYWAGRGRYLRQVGARA